MRSGSFLHELTNWSNLLQGSIGSIVGAVLGVMGAYLAARHSIVGTIKSQRTLDSEREGREYAEKFIPILELLATETNTMLTLRSDEGFSQGLRESLRLGHEQEREQLIRLGADAALKLPSMPAERIDMLSLLLATIDVTDNDSDLMLEKIGAVCRKCAEELIAYRRDPVAQLKKWEREARVVARRRRKLPRNKFL